MFGLGLPELMLIFLVVLLLFGAKRIPDIAHGLGKGIREFKRALKNTEEEGIREFKEVLKDTENEVKTAVKESDQRKSNIENKHNG
ncbi:MAG: twin-arginine translocase TatA/TatE family subunit [candidate division Zixibacteria bacterium]|nr:twin-arginine translocase TatA/TatE family subunit [candidate division Zixibacteria bacterium]